MASAFQAENHRTAWYWVAAAAAAGALTCYAVAVKWLWIGSGKGRWVYPYIADVSIAPLLVWVAASMAAIALLRVRAGDRASRDTGLIAAWAILAMALTGALRSLTPFTLEQIFVSPGANSFYTATLQQRLGSVLSDFDRARAAMPLHAQSNLPGKLALVHLLETMTARPDVLAWIMVALSAAGAFLMYGFVREALGDRRTAVYAALLYLLLPARLFFLPLMNTVTPVVLLAFGWAVARWIRAPAIGCAILSGLLLYVLVFFEPLPLVTGLLFAVLVVRAVATGQLPAPTAAAHIATMAAVFAGTAALVQGMFGFDLIAAFQGIRAHAEAFNIQQRRPYDVWVKANLIEFFFGMGVPAALLAIGAVVVAVQRPEPWRVRLATPVLAVTLSLLAVLAVVDLLGLNRGEVIRLWIFLGSLLQIPAAWVCARTGTAAAMMLIVCITLLQSCLGTALIGFVMP